MRKLLPGVALLLATAAIAQDGALVARVDREDIRQNESFRYILTASGPLSGRPDLSVLSQDFDVLEASRSSSIQIVGGRTTQVAEWVVELMPRDVGRFELPAIELNGDLSNTVTVEILPPAEASGENEDVFIEVELDRERGFVQAQAIYTLRLFVGVGTGRQTLTAPLVEGGEAIVEKLGNDREYQVRRGNRRYNVRERSYAIFPQSAGTLTIGPAVYEAMIMPTTGFARQQRLRSDVLELEVRPAVPPPPEYPGAAWLPAAELRIAERWSEGSDSFVQGVPRTRTVTVTAEGLLETQLPELVIDTVPGLRQYPDRPELGREVTGEGIEARRTERLAVIAQQTGSLELPAVELPWWNVDRERWEVARIDARAIDVAPGVSVTPVTDDPAADPRPAPEEPGEPARPRLWPWLSAGLAAGWFVTVLAWAYTARTRRGPAGGAAVRRPPSARGLLRQLFAACRVNDSGRVRDLLLAWARLQFAEDPPGSLGALAGRLSGPLAAEIRALEAALYGPAAGEWRGEPLASLLRETRAVRRPGAADDKDPLVPLYR
jgi:hypothetical protein